MSKENVKKLMKNGIISVVRCKDYEFGRMVCDELVKAGIDKLEITFSIDGAAKLIKEVKTKYPNALVGAGTVLTLENAKAALESGADFIVAPCIVEEVGQFCKDHDVFCSLAGSTVHEAYTSHLAGSDVVKLFPGEFLSPSIIKTIKSVFPTIDCMPTGGVSDKNIKQWFEAGAYAVGIGGYLTKNVTKENISEVGNRAKLLIEAAGFSK